MREHIYDCIIIGAGPGGLQAAIYLGRYNRNVLLIDRSGGRTWHARHIENVLTHREISGSEIIERGKEQAKHFNVRIEQQFVTRVQKDAVFTVFTKDAVYHSAYVIAASGVYDVIPPIENVYKFLGTSYFTCIDCDGYRTTGRKLIVTGNSLQSMNLAVAMKQMYTPDITYIPWQLTLPEAFTEVLADEGIRVIHGAPVRIIGATSMEGLELKSGEQVPGEMIMASFGIKLNDEYLRDLSLKKDAEKFKYVVNSAFESSLSGLYIVGPLNTGQDQVVIAAGEGALAAIDINKRLLEEREVGEVCALDTSLSKA
jgi:thioredoxin reductase (NADPH)